MTAPSDPLIAESENVSAGDGLTEQFLHHDNLANDEGLDSSTGLPPGSRHAPSCRQPAATVTT